MGFLTTLAATSTISYSDFSSIIDAITAQISVSNVVGVIAAAVPITIAFVFAFWGIRKVTSMIMAGFRKGKVNP